jgi:thiol-disulfide isomerase/thioredoxin
MFTLKRKILVILGALYVVAAIALTVIASTTGTAYFAVSTISSLCSSSEVMVKGQPIGMPETPEYIDGNPVKYQMPPGEANVSYPDNCLLVWTAEWCKSCKKMVTIAEKLEKEGYFVFYIDFDENKKKAKEDGVTKVPTAIIHTNGEEVKRFVGVSRKTEAQIREVLKKSDDYDIY